MSLLGLYVPGGSIVHRAPAAAKLLGLIGLAVLSQLLGQWWQRCLLLVVVVLLYPLARIGLGFALRQLRSLWWVLGAIFVAQLLLTTTTTALSDVVVRVLGPFRRFGVAPERLGLLMALSIRAVPVVLGLAEQIRDAQRARGLPLRPRTFAVPLLVRALRHAQQLGDALIARGLDD